MRLKDRELFRQLGLIGGEWIAGASGEVVDVIDPANQAVLGTVPDMGTAETRAAIEAANAAFGPWKKKTHAERAAVLERWHALMIENLEDLAVLVTMEQGKPLEEARGEIRYGAAFVKWFAEESRRIGGHTIPSPTSDRRIVVLKEAVGVCAVVTPWNFPNAMITRKVAPALAAGCTVVIKPSEFTPFSALALGVLAERAGIPAGVVNIVTGMPTAIGNEFMTNETVRKISFTGSTRVGSLLMRGAADSVKRLSLELGGNAPFIVFDDANLDLAVEGAIASKFRNGGQTCVCANRILVQAGVYDAFAEKLGARVNAMKVGPGTEPGIAIGPMINEAAIDKIDRHVEDAIAKGAKLAARGRSVPGGPAIYGPDCAHRRHHGHAARQRGNLRSRCPALPLRDRRRGDRHRQRHALWAGRLFLHRRPEALLAGGGSTGVWHDRPQHRRHLDRSRALRRRQAIRPRTRGRPGRHRGISRDEELPYRRAGLRSLGSWVGSTQDPKLDRVLRLGRYGRGKPPSIPHPALKRVRGASIPCPCACRRRKTAARLRRLAQG